jgi:hypothetical protein
MAGDERRGEETENSGNKDHGENADREEKDASKVAVEEEEKTGVPARPRAKGEISVGGARTRRDR